jgi:hypothetical protein
MNQIAEFQEQNRQREERKRDEYDLAVLTAAVPGFAGNARRFWVDVQSGQWNTFLLNGVVLQDAEFEKTFRIRNPTVLG